MAFKLGLDFGTTTSILSFIKKETLMPFYYGGETGGTPYVPTVVLYEETDLLIGQFALEVESEEAVPERYFKMRLPLAGADEAGAKSAEDLTTDFIGELVKGTCPRREQLGRGKVSKEAFIKAENAGVESLVIAIPHSWEEDKKAMARTRLRRAVSEHLGLPLTEFVSEPFAAAAFFSYCYKKRKNESFKGNLLVCDMGGGTFDVTLCRIGIDSVNLIAQAGSGGTDEFGIAGNYFDRTLIENRFGALEPGALSALMKELDEEKKKKAKLLERIISNPGLRQRAIYPLSYGVNIYLDDLEKAFSGVRESMDEVLRKVVKEALEKNESLDKVVLVGGFAKFPLVQSAVRDFLNENGFQADDLIDDDVLTSDEMAYAISYGACLIANGLVETAEKFRYTIGVNVTDAAGTDARIDLIKAGTSLSQLADGRLSVDAENRKMPFRIGQRVFEVDFVVESAENGKSFSKTGSFAIPENIDFENRRFFIGGRVDKHSVPHLILQDVESGKRFENSLESIIEYDREK
ncbi:MAG: Hsp70 family protein [Acidobacteriota bacterium]|nr:Hsp70 family protein [Acidobacteriota bacterium]